MATLLPGRAMPFFTTGMITEELLGFIRGQYAAGMSVDEMKNLLIAEGGWDTLDIEEALQTIGILPPPEVPPPPAYVPPVIEHDTAETPLIHLVSSVQYAPPAKTVVSSRVSDTQKAETSPAADDFLGIFSQHQAVKEEPVPTVQTIVFTPPEILPPSPEPKPISEPMPEIKPTPEALSQPHLSAPREIPIIFTAPTPVQAIPPPAPAPVAKEPEIVFNMTPKEIKEVVISPEVPKEIVSPATIAPPPVVPPLPSPTPVQTISPATSVSKEPEIILDMTPREIEEVAGPYVAVKEATPSAAVPPHETPSLAPVTAPQVTPVVPMTPAEDTGKESAKTAPDPVTLDFSMLRKNIANVVDTTAIGKEDEEKIIETKSVAEIWLAGARKQANSLTSIIHHDAAAPTRPKILSKRTMSSDILLRGVGGSIPGMPALSVPEETKKSGPQVETASGFKAEEVKSPTQVKTSPPQSVPVVPAQLPPLHVKVSTGKHIVAVLIGLFVLAASVAGGWYIFLKMRGPDLSMVYGSAFQQFFGVTSFGYRGTATTNLALSAATDGVERNGTVEFTFDYAGMLANGDLGYGDGLHHIKFKGGLHSGNFNWVTDLESDIRLIGSALYFHILSFPETSNADPDLFRTYWVKFDLADISKELTLEGVSGAQEGYGEFGSGSKDTTFNAIIKQNIPFSAGARLKDETLPSGPAYHFELKSNPDRIIVIAGMLYQKYLNANLTLSANQQLRLKDALAKIHGDVLIDQKTNMIMRLSFAGDLDDDIASVHVKGPLALSFDFSDLNKPVAVEVPTPMLTLEELRVRMDDYKKVKDKRAHDNIKQGRLHEIQSSLEAYLAQKGRYPNFLVDLISSGNLSTSTVNEIMIKAYYYASYAKSDMLTKSGLCTSKGKVCSYYHLGVNFEDMTNPLLGNDADQNTELRGGDATGCGGEQNVACFDVVSPPNETSSALAGLPSVSTTTKSLP